MTRVFSYGAIQSSKLEPVGMKKNTGSFGFRRRLLLGEHTQTELRNSKKMIVAIKLSVASIHTNPQ